MSEFNFDKMRNLKIPDEWAENTIKTVNKMKKPAVKITVRPMRLALYLSLLLICLIGVFTFSLPKSNEISSFILDNTETTNLSSHNNSDVIFQQSTDEETIVESFLIQETEETNETEEDLQIDSNIKDPAEEDLSGDSSTSNNSNSAPAEKETVVLNEPTQEPLPPATENLSQDKYDYYVTEVIHNNQLTGSGNVYCKVKSGGKDMGSSELFSPQHEVEIVEKTSIITKVRYYPYRQGVVTRNGNKLYIFSFYNEDGVAVGEYVVYLEK